MTYIKDLIHIPEHVGRGDFVLRLSEGITDPEGTVRHYQVTPQLAVCFDQALGLVRSSLEAGGGRGTSKAAYLHGSFGSGKSHFMAILHLILAGNAHARSIPELAEVVAKHSPWMAGKKFLMVPYHLMNAKNLESAILGGYADFMRRTHPEAPTAPVYRAEGLLGNAELLREAMGDEIFLAKLNRGRGGGGGWGNISAAWDVGSYQAALGAPRNAENCRRLVRDLVDTHLPAMRNTEEFVDLDDGLAVMGSHARELGYDTLVLFLDELILWLASYAADQAFISREGNKVVKLVESNRADRPIPLVSFIARQRDLRDLIGQHIAGAEKLAFSDVLSHHEGRFGVINLEDRNLPAIAAKRILLPKNDAARAQMDAEFERTRTIREETMRTLLTREANREDFRRLYPFSPALVETLVAVSSLLQRERTALKVMAMLLSDQKETLRLGQLVPVGDLYDQVSQGDEAFTTDMKVHFDHANRLWLQHLKPLLEREHGLSFDEARQFPWDDRKRTALRNDDRLMKTLLLAALAPEVESLKNMTPGKLAALNHGTITTPIPGQEAVTVINKLKRWAAAAGQIKIREGAGQTTLAVQLSSVDTEVILARAEGVDNPGNRIAKLKELIFQALGRTNEEELFYTHEFRWRGTPRLAEIIFANVRDLPADSLQNRGGGWKIVIDYPFDSSGHTIRDDVARLETFLTEQEGTRTICWLPSFFNEETLGALGIFVRLEQILKPNQFPSYVQHLMETDRETARNQLESQRDQLRGQLMARIEMAYGIREGGEPYLDQANALEPVDHFRSLDPGVTLQPPPAANLEQALQGLLDQALRQQYPAHPKFPEGLSLAKGSLGKVLENVRAAARSGGPYLVEATQRRQIEGVAGPLGLGSMGQQRFDISRHWVDHFYRQSALAPGNLTVGKLRGWLDQPEAMGLPEPLQDLVILCFAEQTNRLFRRHGGPAAADLGGLTDDMTLEEVTLPGEAEWLEAGERAKAIFGLPVSRLVNAPNVSALSEELRGAVETWKPRARTLAMRLETLRRDRFSEGEDWARVETAREAMALLGVLTGLSGNGLIARLAGFPLRTKTGVLAVALTSAVTVDRALAEADWLIFDSVRELADERRTAGGAIYAELREMLAADEYIMPLGPKLAELRERAVKLLTKVVPAPRPPEPPQPKGAGGRVEPADPPKPLGIEPPHLVARAAAKLKVLYGASQAEGDALPEWLPGEDAAELLRVWHFDPQAPVWEGMLVVSPTLEALLGLDSGATADLAAGVLRLPRFGQTLRLRVDPAHLSV